jgi:ABC-type multidrug transport system ATPase subunit
MGPNGIGKSTLLKILMNELEAEAGEVKWGYETYPGYFAQDHHEQFENPEQTAEDWITGYCPGKTYGFVRGELGRVLLSGDDGKKKLGTLSGGEAARLVFCKLAIERPNVLVLDEPTNHLDMESIEALVEALEAFEGTLILVSHDRWFVSRLADRIVEVTPEGITDYRGSYDEYVHACGDDHLDVDRVVLKARSEKKARKAERPDGAAETGRPGNGESRRSLERELEKVTGRIEEIEDRVRVIEGTFADPAFYDRSKPEETRRLEEERADLQRELEDRMEEWERLERELARRS